MGRCLIATDLPLRQQRRVSNFLAGVDSSPRAPSIGPAVLTDELPPQVHTGRALNWVERGQPLCHPGLVALPGSGAVLEFPGAMPWGVALFPAGAPGGRVERGSATASFILSITKRDQLGGDLLRDGAQRRPGIGFVHVDQHGEPDEQDVAKNVRGLAHVRS